MNIFNANKCLPDGLRFNKGFAIMLVLMMLFLLFMLGVAFFSQHGRTHSWREITLTWKGRSG
jgi:Tfp pilus assembly protein PilX